jgi:hypothetical protein
MRNKVLSRIKRALKVMAPMIVTARIQIRRIHCLVVA